MKYNLTVTPPSPDNLQAAEDNDLYEQLLDWAGLNHDEHWRTLAPSERAKVVSAIKRIASIPIAQVESGAEIQTVVGKRVFNLRPLVVPVVVAILVQAAVIIRPEWESPLLRVLDAVHFAEKAGEVYRTLSDDEVDVFGAVTDLYRKSEICRSVTDPNAHPTARGVSHWFEQNGYAPPEDVDGLLKSLVHKGALLAETLPDGQDLYSPTFLGKKEKHG